MKGYSADNLRMALCFTMERSVLLLFLSRISCILSRGINERRRGILHEFI